MEGPASACRRVSPLSVAGKTMRAAGLGLPYVAAISALAG
jgi:hypothetical protein